MDATPQAYKIKDITTSINSMVFNTKADDWWWVDALYMAMPVFTKLGVIYNNTAYFDKMHALFSNTKNTRHLFDTNTSLWFRDESFDPPYKTPNNLNSYWSRGNGWALGALTRVLQQLPVTDIHRNDYVTTFQAMAAALKNIQRQDGFWNASLVDPNDYGGPETSGTSFFTYGIAWGINNGLLDSATYTPIVIKSWNGLVTMAMHSDGKLGYIQGVGSNPSSSQPVTYESTADFGVGAFLLAGSEIVKLATGVMPQPSTLKITSISILNKSEIKVDFNEAISKSSAETISNYVVDNSTYITNASLSSDNLSVTLTLSSLSSGKHLLTVNNMITLSNNQTVLLVFDYFGFSNIVNVIASSYQPASTNYPENVIDNDSNTRWSAEGIGEWIQFTLTELTNVTSVDIAFFNGNVRKTFFEIYVSKDSVNFNKIFSGESSGTSTDFENFNCTDSVARYVKIVGLGNSASNWNSITEVRINTTDIVIPAPTNFSVQNNVNQEIKVFPNPIKGNSFSVTLTGFSNESVKLTISDLSGRPVFGNVLQICNDNETIIITTNNLHKGIYTVNVTNQRKAYIQKVIVTE